MIKILVIIILVEIALYLLGFGIYVLYTNKKRNENYEKIEKQHEEQMQRIKKKLSNFDLLHEDLKK